MFFKVCRVKTQEDILTGKFFRALSQVFQEVGNIVL